MTAAARHNGESSYRYYDSIRNFFVPLKMYFFHNQMGMRNKKLNNIYLMILWKKETATLTINDGGFCIGFYMKIIK